MEIYRIYTKNRQYKTISYDNTPLLDYIDEETLENIPQIESFPYTWNDDDREKDCGDCPFLIGAIPVFSVKIFNEIEKHLASELVDTIPINVENKKYIIIKAKINVTNLLDERNSQIDRFSDGRIMDIGNYVFKVKNELPVIFRLSEYSLFTFVTGQLAETLLRINPSGLEIEKCKIKKKWFEI